MNKEQIDQVLDKDFEIDMPAGLKGAVLARIEEEKAKKIFRKKALYFCGFFASVSALLFSAIFFGKEILYSDFWSVSSLSFTDFGAVSLYWQEYTLSLLETPPVEAIIIVLIPIFIMLVFVKRCFQEFQYFAKLQYSK